MSVTAMHLRSDKVSNRLHEICKKKGADRGEMQVVQHLYSEFLDPLVSYETSKRIGSWGGVTLTGALFASMLLLTNSQYDLSELSGVVLLPALIIMLVCMYQSGEIGRTIAGRKSHVMERSTEERLLAVVRGNGDESFCFAHVLETETRGIYLSVLKRLKLLDSNKFGNAQK